MAGVGGHYICTEADALNGKSLACVVLSGSGPIQRSKPFA